MEHSKYPRLRVFLESHPEMTRDQVHDYIEKECKKLGIL